MTTSRWILLGLMIWFTPSMLLFAFKLWQYDETVP